MKTLTFLSALTLVASGPALADTIHLTNGYEINGTIDADASTEQELVVKIGDNGLLRLRKGAVATVQKNARTGIPAADGAGAPTPAVARPMIRVHLKENAIYGSGSIHGARRPESTEDLLVLETPGAGITKIARAAIEKIEPYRPVVSRPAAAAATSEDGTMRIKTTHVIYFKKGGSVRGNVIASDDPERITVEIDGMGYTSILKHWIEKVEAESGEIVLPPKPDREPATPETTSARVETPKAAPSTDEAPALDLRLEAEIARAVTELGRQRTRNRVRAEAALRRIGADAIPKLADVIHHPFDLTRRAAMRVIRDVADPAGLPYAIDGLLDEDIWVRRHAADAVRAITRRDLGYRPNATPRSRVEAHDRWVEYLDSLLADAR